MSQLFLEQGCRDVKSNNLKLTIGVYAVGVWVDEINGDPEVRLSQKLMLVLLL